MSVDMGSVDGLKLGSSRRPCRREVYKQKDRLAEPRACEGTQVGGEISGALGATAAGTECQSQAWNLFCISLVFQREEAGL